MRSEENHEETFQTALQKARRDVMYLLTRLQAIYRETDPQSQSRQVYKAKEVMDYLSQNFNKLVQLHQPQL